MSSPLLDRVAELARDQFAPRADDYDRRASFPAEDFEDLFDEGLLVAALPVNRGGLGLGPHLHDTLPLWTITKLLAKADLSLARCWEGHTNSMVLVESLGSEDQKQRWYKGVIEQGDIWVAWSGEPPTPKTEKAPRFGTAVTRVDGGWVVEGTKAFATSSTNASWAILLVDPAGPGGARHSTGSRGGVLMLACELADPAVTIDTGWWDPLGMRGTVSHVVSFDRAYIPEENLIGAPGSYFSAGWQTAFIPQYAASFLGAAEAAYEFALEYVKVHNKASDPYVHHRVGAMAVNVATGDLWLRHVAALWDAGKLAEAALAGNYARHLIEHLAEETVQHCIRACGARSLMRPSCVERILRDLTFYERHDNDDQVLATIGRSVLGEPTDLAFATPPPVPGENQV